MRTHNFKKDIDYRLFYGLVIVMVLLMNVLLNDALGRGSLCSPCDSSKCLCCRDCQCYFQCPYDKACIVEITGHDLCYEGCHYNTICTGSMNGTYTLQPYGDECDWGAVYPSNLTLTLFYDVNHPYCPNPPNTEPCTCVYLPFGGPGILVFHFHCWGSSAFLYIYHINPDTGEGGEEIFCGGTNSVTNCIECTISDSNPVFCPNGHWASPTAKITVNSDPTCASCCNTALCETCVGGECKVCGGDTNKKCCYPDDGINHCCKSSETCCNGSCCNTEGCPTCPIGGLPITLTVFPVISTSTEQCGGCGETGGECGAVGPPIITEVTIPTPCFDSCKWKFGVSATANYCYGPCFSQYLNIENGWSTYLTPLNCINIAYGFRYGNGCVDFGGSHYSNADCLWIHEYYHLMEYSSRIEIESLNLRNNSALSDMDCPGGADSCQSAYDARAESIRQAVHEAYDNAYGICDETAAANYARPCFSGIADSICENCVCPGG